MIFHLKNFKKIIKNLTFKQMVNQRKFLKHKNNINKNLNNTYTIKSNKCIIYKYNLMKKINLIIKSEIYNHRI